MFKDIDVSKKTSNFLFKKLATYMFKTKGYVTIQGFICIESELTQVSHGL